METWETTPEFVWCQADENDITQRRAGTEYNKEQDTVFFEQFCVHTEVTTKTGCDEMYDYADAGV